MTVLRTAFLAALCSLVSFAAARAQGSLDVQITALRSSQGRILYSLYRSAQGFPGDAAAAYKTGTAPIRNSQARITFDDLPPGDYAFSYVHDEDGDGKLKTGMFGIPKEGYGASNNAKGNLGPPKYRDAQFRVLAGQTARQSLQPSY